jgi:hypothetical protein
MGRRLRAWGNPDLKNISSFVLYSALGNASPKLPNPPKAWKSIPELLGGTYDDAIAKISRVQDLLDSKTGLPDDDSWYSRRPIGAGGFGVAALFEKVGDNGQLVDVRNVARSRQVNVIDCGSTA